MSDARPAPLDVLRQRWGFDAFRPGQDEAIHAVCEGRDTLAVLPTGGGKSLVFQVPALVRGGVALVVSPLVALMQDQVDALARRGIRAAHAHSGLGRRALEQLWTDAEFGRYPIVYLTPERLGSELFRARAPRLPVSLLAVDEAHCISEWGHDFRPAYRRIAESRQTLTDASGDPAPVVAVTATATPEVRRDILDQLALRDPEVVVRGFDRPNLIWSVHHVEDKTRQVLDVFEGVPGSGLVYAGTRRATEEWARRLSASGVGAEAYHAGLAPEARTAVQRRWLSGETRVVCATSAFGMGIDKPDVRAVVHVALPPTLESYYQEGGRAGRDGQTAYCAFVVGSRDDELPRAMASGAHPTPEQVQAVYAATGSLGGLAVGAEPDGPMLVDLPALSTLADVKPSVARAALAHLARQDVWDLHEPRGDRMWIRARQSAADVRAYADAQEGPLAAFVTRVLRALPPEAYSEWTRLWTDMLATATDLSPTRLARGLGFLAERGILDVRQGTDAVVLTWSGPRVERAPIDAVALAHGRQRAVRGVEHVVRYVESVGCRRQHLLAYFGESAPSRCGRCDVCLGRHRPAEILPADEAALREILAAVDAGQPRAQWAPDVSPRRRDALADWLLAESLLDLVDPLDETYRLTPKGIKAIRRSASTAT